MNQKVRAHFGYTPRKCNICGKEFSTTPQYVYKRGQGKFFCSYTCMRKFDTEKASKPRKPMTEEQKAKARANSKYYYWRKKEQMSNELRTNNS